MQKQQGAAGTGDQLEDSSNELGGLMKSEKHLTPGKRKLVTQQDKIVSKFMEEWEKDSQEALEKILSIAGKHAKKA